MNNGVLWGIDLGGTKIEGVILDTLNQNKILFRERVPTEASKGYTHVLNQVKHLFDSMVAHQGTPPTTLGIGTPGTLIPSTGLMKNSNAVALNGKPMRDDLSQLLDIQIEMANDANCFALAEAKLGVVKELYPEAKVVFGVILGTGVGGGLVVNGQVINGHHSIGGEWGHSLLPGFEGRQCFCGKTGDNESILSGPSLEWYYHQQTGVQKELKEIVALARSKSDHVAVQTLQRLTSGFAQAISVVINIIDPDVIVIGGGVGNIDELYSDGRAAINQHMFNHDFQAAMVKPALGDSAGVFGAAFLTEN
ncbi:ROK family protein [Reichenbachiella agarivorans]|uniref:ROK family protein n=1 Tax=Reichenbachiella agarivorans TaxID=2979464 RepID=A0ABY6CQ34_9BACT|nr:ROK family protein [Reichenbachiella agarivorans]UXP32634.1 ROK family protein [Reichenbachiella agarivorans]